MAVWCVTGKLGSGKTLVSVSRILLALEQGRTVATNLDLHMPWLTGWQSKKSRVYRVPDKPTRADLDALGSGNRSYDESKNGLLVLDECGSWFNSRDWNNAGRREILDWLLHARKLGWDIIFIIQDASAIDKQARKMFLEHIVYCRRMDRMSIPIVTFLFSLAGFEVRLPRMHIGFVTYGDQQHSPVVDKWMYRGTHLFRAYDTKQAFSDSYNRGLYMYLPASYWKRTPSAKKNLRYLMNLTKIHFRRYSRIVAFGVGIAIASGAAYGLMQRQQSAHLEQVAQLIEQNPEQETEQLPEPETRTGQTQEVKNVPLWQLDLVVSGYAKLPGEEIYFLNDAYGRTWRSTHLAQRGFRVVGRGKCEVLWISRTNPDQQGSAHCTGVSS